MVAESPLAVAVTRQLELITVWMCMHCRVLESLESHDFFGYTYFSKSNSYSTIVTQVLGLKINDSGSTMMSLSGIEKLDQQLNLIKTKTFEFIRQILDYSFNKIETEHRSVVPLTHKISGLAPLMIQTAHQFATSPQLDQKLLDDGMSEFIIQLIEILALLSDEREYFEIFVEN